MGCFLTWSCSAACIRAKVAEYLLLQHPATVADVNSSLDTMLHCAIKGLETDPETMTKMVTLLISLEAPLDIPGAVLPLAVSPYLHTESGGRGFGMRENAMVRGKPTMTFKATLTPNELVT